MHDLSLTIVELGAAFVGLAILARIASSWGFSAIPLYLIAGLCFGKGGIAPLDLSQSFISLGAEIGVLLLLFMLGVEYSAEELADNLKKGFGSGFADFALNFTPGLIAGLLLGWKPLPAVLFGGVTWVSSSGIIAKLLTELKRSNLPETKSILSILVLEDLAMAVYLPLVSVLMTGGPSGDIFVSVAIALVTVAGVLTVALKFGGYISKFLLHESDEIILLTVFGLVLLVAGISQRLNVSEAVGAFLVGIALSGQIAKRSEKLFRPLRDLFAATFFFFFGMEVDPHTLPPVMVPAIIIGVITALTKVGTGWFASRNTAEDRAGRIRAGVQLIARGEFSIVIAGLGTALEPRLGPLAAAYVLFLAIVGPIVARFVK